MRVHDVEIYEIKIFSSCVFFLLVNTTTSTQNTSVWVFGISDQSAEPNERESGGAGKSSVLTIMRVATDSLASVQKSNLSNSSTTSQEYAHLDCRKGRYVGPATTIPQSVHVLAGRVALYQVAETPLYETDSSNILSMLLVVGARELTNSFIQRVVFSGSGNDRYR